MDSITLAKTFFFCSDPLIAKLPGGGHFSHQLSLVLRQLLVVLGALDLEKSPVGSMAASDSYSLCTDVSLELQIEGQRLYLGACLQVLRVISL